MDFLFEYFGRYHSGECHGIENCIDGGLTLIKTPFSDLGGQCYRFMPAVRSTDIQKFSVGTCTVMIVLVVSLPVPVFAQSK